ncbi:MAG: hypothetical protein ACE5ER_10085, partial [Nitrospinaceae bacterium]
GCSTMSIIEFQSTLPHGERRDGIGLGYGRDRVSIHAPARGATSDRDKHLSGSICFNPRSRTGSDCAPFFLLFFN